MKIKCSECGKRIRAFEDFRIILGQNMHESCYQKLGGYDFYSELMKLETGESRPVGPPGHYRLE